MTRLRPAERRLLHAVVTGTLVDLRRGNAELDDPAQTAAWGGPRTVRAELLTQLLTGERPPQDGRLRAVKLRGARITGPLDLESRTLACPLLLWDCSIEQPVNFHDATAPKIGLPGCDLPALAARQLRTTGDLNLLNLSAHGHVNVAGAHIGGQLALAGASLENENGPALTADGITVGQGMFCRAGFTARGEVRLIGAHIGRQLDLDGANLENENGPALTADGLTVDGHMFCRAGFTARGEVRLPGAHIGGQLDLTGASLDGASLENKNGPALTARLLTVGQDMLCRADQDMPCRADQDMPCRPGFTARGEVHLVGAHIGGQLDLTGASLENENGPALTADRLTVNQDMFGGPGFSAHGEVRLIGAHIGQLDLTGAHLKNENGPALTADGLTVNQAILGQAGFTARGEVRLPGAHIGEQVVLDGATLENENGRALNAERLTVDGSMLCRTRFTARGELHLVAAHIGGQLNLAGASLENENGPALNAERLTVNQDMFCGPGFSARGGEVNLINAKVGSFVDDLASWPMKMRLRGFVYDVMENDQVSVQQRLGWLTRDADGYFPQVYDQLAAAYRNAGREEWARRVAIAKQRKRRNDLNPLNWLWYLTVGYGYRTWLAGAWLAVFLAVGTWVFSQAHMIAIGTHPPAFHPFAYTADVILPVINLGQKSAWQPQGSALYWSWGLTGAGWVLTTAVVAGLTGVLKRD